MKLAVLVSLLVIVPFQVVTGSCVGKTVDVWVVNGQSLTGDGPLNDPEPYVKVSIGSQIRTTSVIHSSSNPSWWEEFRFFNASGNMLKIEIWEADSGLRGDDDHLGTCTEQLISGGAQYHAIQCRASDSGYVKVIYKCF
ncbi:multiple C2 and transmembrane domain-containing protein 1-like [Larimichthys crocea]|uniref:multiple C2 and transmembrane domain-containing protein 1-like n=1 Tax=Larimichthys crocea TaxID=215358 RepID=UPI000F5ED8E0|nr:multiple C2 and transmembrane domain-containing protein 1-like [Larimichthys crocea]